MMSLGRFPAIAHRTSARRLGAGCKCLALTSLILATASLQSFAQPPIDSTTPSSNSTSGQTGDDITASNVKSKITPLTEDNEVRLGRASAEANDKHIQLVTDAAIVARVNRIGKEIAEAANTYPVKPKYYGYPQVKQFDYTFKVVNEKDVNAYSIPGGHIYVNKGLLDYVRSDDELAGVLAHEVSHAAHHHMMKMMKDQNSMQNLLLAGIVGAAVAARGNGQATAGLLQGGYLVALAQNSTWSVAAEKDADYSGIMLLTHTKYNPVGLYSFMIRMAADEDRKNFVDMGILRTHPPGAERVESARAELESLKIPIELSKVDPTLLISVKVVKGPAGAPEMAEMSIRSVALCRVVGVDGKSAEQHAWDIAKQLNKEIDDEIQPFEIHVLNEKNKIAVRGITVITQADADAQGRTIEDIGKRFSDSIMLINQRKQLEAPHQ